VLERVDEQLTLVGNAVVSEQLIQNGKAVPQNWYGDERLIVNGSVTPDVTLTIFG